MNLLLFCVGFSNISVYVSKEDQIKESDIEDLKNLTKMKNEMDVKEYADELKKFTIKYPLCGSYNEAPTLEHVMIDVTCQFPFEVRYVLFLKNSVSHPSYLTFNDVQFKLKGKNGWKQRKLTQMLKITKSKISIIMSFFL